MIADESRRQFGRDIAFRIRAELVCCRIFDEIHDGHTSEEVDVLLREHAEKLLRHALCYWGEASARLAEGRCPGHDTTPDICQCDCSGCVRSCNDHVEPEDDPEPKCICGHPERMHIPTDKVFGPQCKVCPEDGERAWRHPYTPEGES